MNKKEIVEKVKKCGVVGAGGGGFPTHIKINAQVDTLIANGAECEPLLCTDQYIMETRAKEIIEGLRTVKHATGANNVFLALKEKCTGAIEELNKVIGMSSDIEMFLLENYYPAGDEFELVYNISGKVIPEGGIPSDVGAAVINVNSLLNVFHAVNDDSPVVKRWVTVAGELKEPYIAEVPVGIAVKELIDAGKPGIADYSIIAGGPMMGEVVKDTFYITKLSGGVLVLPPDNPAVIKQGMDISVQHRRGKSVCDQCFDCTIVCPRNLLGHDLSPHLIMRNLFIAPADSVHLSNAYLCSECGLCDMFGCPMDLSPRGLLRAAKEKLNEQGSENPHNSSKLSVHPERSYRRVNQDRLMVRIGMKKYETHELPVKNIETGCVKISLSQHTGVQATPVVKKGQKVKEGDLIGDIPEGSSGARVHAGIGGVVRQVTDGFVEIQA